MPVTMRLYVLDICDTILFRDIVSHNHTQRGHSASLRGYAHVDGVKDSIYNSQRRHRSEPNASSYRWRNAGRC